MLIRGGRKGSIPVQSYLSSTQLLFTFLVNQLFPQPSRLKMSSFLTLANAVGCKMVRSWPCLVYFASRNSGSRILGLKAVFLIREIKASPLNPSRGSMPVWKGILSLC